jgi:hypothetical protein
LLQTNRSGSPAESTMRRGTTGILFLLISCTSYRPPPPPAPREATHVNASMGRTWDALINQFGARDIPIRTIQEASGLVVTDQLSVGREGYRWADCGLTGGGGSDNQKPPLPVGPRDPAPESLGPTHATYNVLVRGDSLESTVKATVRWVHNSRECTTNHSWERALELQVKQAAELNAPVPPRIRWIASRRTRTYYQVGCPAADDIASSDRVLFETEASALVAGYSPGRDC